MVHLEQSEKKKKPGKQVATWFAFIGNSVLLFVFSGVPIAMDIVRSVDKQHRGIQDLVDPSFAILLMKKGSQPQPVWSEGFHRCHRFCL